MAVLGALVFHEHTMFQRVLSLEKLISSYYFQVIYKLSVFSLHLNVFDIWIVLLFIRQQTLFLSKLVTFAGDKKMKT